MNEGKTDILKHWHIVPYKKVCFANAFDMKWNVEILKDEPVNLINVYNNFDIPPKPNVKNVMLNQIIKTTFFGMLMIVLIVHLRKELGNAQKK